ncbi:hypothetical protein D5S18_31345 [Nocardia panacis]|uniref:Sensor domain-containing protein n=2 Tax=Nocardia panacis TaxID=2340916 RepID=A0A3A4K026_9NOCA|nr:hypothetical protein D5S18_31345 [Nocardia panacis]
MSPLGPAVVAAPVAGAPITDSDRLRGLLLSGADLPPSFTELPDRNLDTAAAGLAPTTPAACAKILTPLATQRTGALARASVEFVGPDFAGIDIDAATYANDVVPQAFSEIQATLRGCTHYTGSDGARLIDYRLGSRTGPSAGDAETGFQVRTESDGLVLSSSVAIVQVGATLVQISVTARERVDPGVLGDLTAAQVRLLRGTR